MIYFSKPDIEQYIHSYVINNFDITNDEKHIYFTSNLNGEFNIWAIDISNPFPYPISMLNQLDNMIKISPDLSFLLTSFDKDGDENYQIYALPLHGGSPKLVIPESEHSKYYFCKISKDSQRLYYTTNKDNPTYFNINRYDLKTKEEKILVEGNNGTTYLLDVSPDEKSFAYIKMLSNTFMVGYIQTNQGQICVTPSASIEHTVSDFIFFDDEVGYFITDYDSNFSYLASFNIPTKKFTSILKMDKESAKILKYDKKNSLLYVVTEKGVADCLYKFNLSSKSVSPISIPVTKIEQLEVTQSGNIYILGDSAPVPLNIYRRSKGEKWTSLTNNRVLGVAESNMIEPKVITYPSYDGTVIEALFYQANQNITNRHTIVIPHGGPQESEHITFKSLYQYLLAYGYSIFAPNFRGSSGYGKSFTKLVEGDWGGGPRLDCMYGIEWLIEKGIIEKDKLFLFGASYGGYLSLLLAAKQPEFFRGIIDMFGPTNLFTFIESVPEHWKPIIIQLIGDPVKNREKLKLDSPINYLDDMNKPMMIVQGANDPRVHKTESDQIVKALKDRNVNIDYVVLDDEGHGLSKRENKIKIYKLILAFLERYRNKN